MSIDYEYYIRKLNDLLEKFERPKVVGETYPNIFIFGVPRSGTTLLSQILAYCLDIGYINNLIARFWKCPYVGVILSQHLKIPKKISFKSYYGRTPEISDPNEFGYFWAYHLRYRSSKNMKIDENDRNNIDWIKLKKEILAINYAFQKPCVFKCVLLGAYIKELSEILNKSIFVYIERDPFDNAVSLLKAREEFFGDRRKWWSLKPREYNLLKNKSPEEQVVGQVYYLRKEFEKSIKGCDRVIKITYEELCENPMEIVERVRKFVKKKTGDDIKVVNEVKSFKVEKFNKNDYPKIAKALKQYDF